MSLQPVRGSNRSRRPLKKPALVFSALGDQTRLLLVERLSSEGPMSIARLTRGGSLTRQAVTKHLHVLARAGIAGSSRSGRQCVWQLEPDSISEARRCLDLISAQWDAALNRLKAFVEG